MSSRGVSHAYAGTGATFGIMPQSQRPPTPALVTSVATGSISPVISPKADDVLAAVTIVASSSSASPAAQQAHASPSSSKARLHQAPVPSQVPQSYRRIASEPLRTRSDHFGAGREQHVKQTAEPIAIRCSEKHSMRKLAHRTANGSPQAYARGKAMAGWSADQCAIRQGEARCPRPAGYGYLFCHMHQCAETLVDSSRCANAVEPCKRFCKSHNPDKREERLGQLQNALIMRATWDVTLEMMREEERKQALEEVKHILRYADAETQRDPQQPRLGWDEWLRTPVHGRSRSCESSTSPLQDEPVTEEEEQGAVGVANEDDDPEDAFLAELMRAHTCGDGEAIEGYRLSLDAQGEAADSPLMVNSISTLIASTASFNPSERQMPAANVPERLASPPSNGAQHVALATDAEIPTAPLSPPSSSSSGDCTPVTSELGTPYPPPQPLSETPIAARILMVMLESEMGSPQPRNGSRKDLAGHSPCPSASSTLTTVSSSSSSARSPSSSKRASRSVGPAGSAKSPRRARASRSVTRTVKRAVRFRTLST